MKSFVGFYKEELKEVKYLLKANGWKSTFEYSDIYKLKDFDFSVYEKDKSYVFIGWKEALGGEIICATSLVELIQSNITEVNVRESKSIVIKDKLIYSLLRRPLILYYFIRLVAFNKSI